MTFYFLFEANCSIFVKGALSIVDIGFYEHVKGLVHMEFFHIHWKINLVLYSYKNNGRWRLDLNVNSYDPFSEINGAGLP